ncbi:zinc ribbon domain-containing protein [Vibrio alginolyticus]|nr:zinc ribbon domain-containing protein [Vibrio alginolyticus]
MIIWGSKGREIVEEEGSFFCPECQKETNYCLKRVGKYFTLYFIPLFQTKELGKFVECSQCLTQFKPEILNYDPSPIVSSAANEEEERLFLSACELVQMQMAGASLLYEEQISKMDHDQNNRYLAFELGVIEYFDRSLLSISETENSNVRFFNFLIYYSNKTYGANSEAVFQLWHSLAVHGLMHTERELGFNSVNNQTNPDGTRREGHFPGKYLKEAVGFEL